LWDDGRFSLQNTLSIKMNPKLQNIDHIHVFVPDRQEALDWYSTKKKWLD